MYTCWLFCLIAFHRIYMYICFLFFATTSLVNKDLYILVGRRVCKNTDSDPLCSFWVIAI